MMLHAVEQMKQNGDSYKRRRLCEWDDVTRRMSMDTFNRPLTFTNPHEAELERRIIQGTDHWHPYRVAKLRIEDAP